MEVLVYSWFLGFVYLFLVGGGVEWDYGVFGVVVLNIFLEDERLEWGGWEEIFFGGF